MEVVILCFEKLGRISNIGENHVTGVLTIGIKDQRRFQRGERHRDIGLHSWGRNIHGNHRRTRKILRNALDNRAVETLDWFSYTRSEKRIDNDIRIEQLELFLIPIVFIQDDSRRVPERLQNVQICFGITLYFFFGCEQEYKRKTPLLNQLARDDETIASVVPFPAQNRDGQLIQVFELLFENLGHTHTRVLHENQTRNSVFFTGKAIDFAELFRREDFHRREIRGQTGEFPIFELQNREFTRLTPNFLHFQFPAFFTTCERSSTNFSTGISCPVTFFQINLPVSSIRK